MKVIPKGTVETLLTMDEMIELMNEHYASISFDGPLPPIEDTNYLAEMTDEE